MNYYTIKLQKTVVETFRAENKAEAFLGTETPTVPPSVTHHP
jgi:hypothetical protein